MKIFGEKKKNVISFVHIKYFIKPRKLGLFDKIESFDFIFFEKGPSFSFPVKVISLLQGWVYLNILFKSLGDDIHVVSCTVTIYKIIQGQK